MATWKELITEEMGEQRVYFPVSYGGEEWVTSVSRKPDGVSTEHIGG